LRFQIDFQDIEVFIISFYKQYFHKNHILDIRISMNKREKKNNNSQTNDLFMTSKNEFSNSPIQSAANAQ